MIIGVFGDTHNDKQKAIPHIIAEFEKRGVQIILNTGDIAAKHVDKELFGNFPVFCALTDEQAQICELEKRTKSISQIPFCSPPPNWVFTHPGDRIVDLLIGNEKVRVYLGHKRSFEILMGSENELDKTLKTISRDYDDVILVLSGHTHHQIAMKNRGITFCNPGAVERSMGIAGGYEYMIIDTDTNKLIYSRLPASQSIAPSLKVAMISDSLNISKRDPKFWKKLADTFLEANVTDIIHCGNIDLDDIGIEELNKFQIHYNLILNQKKTEKPDNWHQTNNNKIVELEGYQFFVQWNLSSDLLYKSELDMQRLALQIQKQHPKINFILSGFTHTSFYEEAENLIFLNPGDIIQGRNYAIVEMPNYEITLGRIPYDPLPAL